MKKFQANRINKQINTFKKMITTTVAYKRKFDWILSKTAKYKVEKRKTKSVIIAKENTTEFNQKEKQIKVKKITLIYYIRTKNKTNQILSGENEGFL